MKKFIRNVLLLAAFCVVFTVAVCVPLDPYNVLFCSKIRDNGVEPNKNYIKMKYILKNPDLFDSFVFGSSRVGALHMEEVPDMNCFNMTYSQGVPAEHLANLKTFLDNGIVPERIFIGVDNISYTYDPEKHTTEPMRCPYEYLKKHPLTFCSMYLNPSLAVDSLEVMKGHERNRDYEEYFFKYGDWTYYGGATLADKGPEAYEVPVGPVMRMDETLGEIAEIAALCRANDIELVVFTNPMVDMTYQVAVQQDYLTFLERLAEVTPYYNFSGPSDISRDYSYFSDSSHYTAYVGNRMIDCMINDNVDERQYSLGFGWYVTPDNVENLLDIMREQ